MSVTSCPETLRSIDPENGLSGSLCGVGSMQYAVQIYTLLFKNCNK
jgi:hypothetical protein